MTRNLPSLRAIALDPSLVSALDLDGFAALFEDLDAETKILAAAKRALTDALHARYVKLAAAMYEQKGSDYGTIRIADAGYDVVIDTPKKVAWDETRLHAIADKITAAGDNPGDYLKTTLSVDERSYTAWPPAIRAVFEPARTTKPGTRTVKLVRREAEAA